MRGILTAILAFGLATAAAAAGGRSLVHTAKYSDDGQGQRVLISEATEHSAWLIEGDAVREESFPRYIEEHEALGPERIVILSSQDPEALRRELRRRGVRQDPGLVLESDEAGERADEVVTLVNGGDPSNRIDVVFMGDGYTLDEREKFFADIQRMVGDMFEDATFRSYLPLFNVHAVFRPSNESGIGRNDIPKDTAYGLYRLGNTLRAIYYDRPSAIRNSCNQAPGCDYPVVIGNDPHYGGLGGEFAISTSSVTSGTVVLRHELGHNFGRVGEEYDGGGYFGANHSSSLTRLGWAHWATEEHVEAEPSVSRFVAWPWKNLQDGPFQARFESDGTYDYAQIRFSASGLPTEDALKVILDQELLTFPATGNDDRNFYNISREGFASGEHVMEFRELMSDGNNWMSSINIQEYREGYHFEDDFYGAFPVYGQTGRPEGYRATHEACLMRNMQSSHFCNVCQENNWLQFFGKVRIIDELQTEERDDITVVRLATQGLGQLRHDFRGTALDGSLVVRWFKDGTEVPELQDRFEWQLPTRDARGEWEARVQFETPEVRHDPRGLLSDSESVRI